MTRRNGWIALGRVLGVTAALLALAGCASGLNDKRELLGGVAVEFDQAEVGRYALNQTQVMNRLIVLSGQTGVTESAINWKSVVDAGVDYSDAQCERYVDSIFWFDRQKNGVKNQIDILGTATAGILGATEAAAKSISITAIAFGLGSQSVENYGKGLLYEIDPAALREVVEKSQATYLNAIQNSTYTNRAAAMRAIRGYLSLCLPATLESQINKSVSISQFQSVEPPEGKPSNNFVPQIEQVSPQQVVYSSAAIRAARPLRLILSNPTGGLDQAKVVAMRTRCWPGAGVPADTKITDFLLGDGFVGARAAVQACMGG